MWQSCKETKNNIVLQNQSHWTHDLRNVEIFANYVLDSAYKLPKCDVVAYEQRNVAEKAAAASASTLASSRGRAGLIVEKSRGWTPIDWKAACMEFNMQLWSLNDSSARLNPISLPEWVFFLFFEALAHLGDLGLEFNDYFGSLSAVWKFVPGSVP